MPVIKTIKDKAPEEREEEALQEGLTEGEIIYRSVRQDGIFRCSLQTSRAHCRM